MIILPYQRIDSVQQEAGSIYSSHQWSEDKPGKGEKILNYLFFKTSQWHYSLSTHEWEEKREGGSLYRTSHFFLFVHIFSASEMIPKHVPSHDLFNFPLSLLPL